MLVLPWGQRTAAAVTNNAAMRPECVTLVCNTIRHVVHQAYYVLWSMMCCMGLWWGGAPQPRLYMYMCAPPSRQHHHTITSSATPRRATSNERTQHENTRPRNDMHLCARKCIYYFSSENPPALNHTRRVQVTFALYLLSSCCLSVLSELRAGGFRVCGLRHYTALHRKLSAIYLLILSFTIYCVLAAPIMVMLMMMMMIIETTAVTLFHSVFVCVCHSIGPSDGSEIRMDRCCIVNLTMNSRTQTRKLCAPAIIRHAGFGIRCWWFVSHCDGSVDLFCVCYKRLVCVPVTMVTTNRNLLSFT